MASKDVVGMKIQWPVMAVWVRFPLRVLLYTLWKTFLSVCHIKYMKVSEVEIVEACKSSLSMSEAASKVGLHFNTFKRYAQKFGVYTPNQGGKGKSKPYNGKDKIPLQEILDGKHPSYQTYKLKNRLFKEGLKEEKCEECGIEDWNGKPLAFELEHIDGDRTNHRFENLKILCPNCHSQTPTFRAKNRKNGCQRVF